MSKIFPNGKHDFEAIYSQYGISASVAKAIVFGPFLIILCFLFFSALPQTRDLMRALIKENAPVELLTFILFLCAGVGGLVLAFGLKKQRAEKFVFWFYVVLSIAFIVIAMEEIAWGQWFFNFDTPARWAEINAQQELTLHNFKGIQSHLEVFPLMAGLLGILGIKLSSISFFRKITPPEFLFPWFLVITLITGVDLFQDYIILNTNLDILVNALDEVVEMMISICALLLVWLNYKRFIGGEHHKNLIGE